MAGGKRQGVGPPKGSTNRPEIRQHLIADDVKVIVVKALTLAKEGNEAC